MLCNNLKPEIRIEQIRMEDFAKMNKTEKVSNLLKGGRELMCREENGFVISLYLLTDFFVEVWYRSPSKKIDRIEVSTNEEVLANYEEEIDLTDLF